MNDTTTESSLLRGLLTIFPRPSTSTTTTTTTSTTSSILTSESITSEELTTEYTTQQIPSSTTTSGTDNKDDIIPIAIGVTVAAFFAGIVLTIICIKLYMVIKNRNRDNVNGLDTPTQRLTKLSTGGKRGGTLGFSGPYSVVELGNMDESTDITKSAIADKDDGYINMHGESTLPSHSSHEYVNTPQLKTKKLIKKHPTARLQKNDSLASDKYETMCEGEGEIEMKPNYDTYTISEKPNENTTDSYYIEVLPDAKQKRSSYSEGVYESVEIQFPAAEDTVQSDITNNNTKSKIKPKVARKPKNVTKDKMDTKNPQTEKENSPELKHQTEASINITDNTRGSPTTNDTFMESINNVPVVDSTNYYENVELKQVK